MTNMQIICISPSGAETVLFDSAKPDTHWFTKAVFSPSTDAAGKFVFTFLKQHPSAQKVQLMGADIQVRIGRHIIFCGRPITVDEDIHGRRIVTCEGNLNWAMDVPDLFTNPFSNQFDYYVCDINDGDHGYVNLNFEAEKVVEDGKTKYTGIYTHTWAEGEYIDTFGAENEGQEFEFLYRLPSISKKGTGSYRGLFKCTAYCGCYECSEGYGNMTATGVTAQANHTIAVDPSVIPYGTWVIIDGHRYKAEDTGEAIVGNHIDIFFDEHEDAENYGVQWHDVYLADADESVLTDTWAVDYDTNGVMIADDEISVKAVCERYYYTNGTYGAWVNYIGNLGLLDERLSGNTANSSVDLATGPFGGVEGALGYIVLRCREHANAKLDNITVAMIVRKRNNPPVNEMFYLMFPKHEDPENGYNYNGFCSPYRKLYGGDCDITGDLAYSPATGASCLDTLREWQKTFGGYLYTRLVDSGSGSYWTINYTKEPGEDDPGAVFELGENIIDISFKKDAQNVLTEIKGVGKDDKTGEEITLSMYTINADVYGYFSRGLFYTDIECTKQAYLADGMLYYDIPTGKLYEYSVDDLAFNETSASGKTEFDEFIEATTEAEGVKLIAYSNTDFPITGYESGYRVVGFVRNNKYPQYGQVLTVRQYDIPHLEGNKAAMRRILYGKIVEDLNASVEEAESVRITTIDPRLLGTEDTNIFVGNRYKVKSKQHGIDRYMELSSMELDLLSPQNSKMTFGEARPLASNNISVKK